MKWRSGYLKYVLSEPYNRGVNGRDYQELVPELQQELWCRQQIAQDKALRERERLEQQARTHFLRLIRLYRTVGFTYEQADELRSAIELFTGQETCPFVWAIYGGHHAETI